MLYKRMMETVKNRSQSDVVEAHERKFNLDFLEKYLLEFNEIYNELKGKVLDRQTNMY